MTISAQIQGGEGRTVQIESRLGKPCIRINPFGAKCRMEDGRGNVTVFDQERIAFDTEPEGCYVFTGLV